MWKDKGARARELTHPPPMAVQAASFGQLSLKSVDWDANAAAPAPVNK